MTSNSNPIKPIPIIRKLLKSENFDIQTYSEKDQNGVDMLYLNKNENPFPPPIEIIDSLNLKNIAKQYPDPNATEFINNLSLEIKISPSHLLAGSGSDDLLDLIIRTYAKQNTIILGVTPSFSMYEFYAKINGARYETVPLSLKINPKDGIAQYELDQARFIQKAKRSKIIILARPNNPDGSIFPRDFIIELLKLRKMVIIDEAYIDFSDEPSLIKLMQDYNNLILTRSFSKSYSLAGLRLGYMIANPQIISILNCIRSPYIVNNIALTFGVLLLNNKNGVKKNITKIKMIREEFYQQLLDLRKRYGKIFYHRSGANFVLLRGESLELARSLFDYFLMQNIKLRKFEGQLANCVRITLGTRLQMKKVIQILDTFLGGI